MIFALILFLVEAATSPVAPWWAGPIYVSSLERILIAWGQAFIVAAFPIIATIIRGIKSHREHKQNLEVAREAVAGRDEIKAAIEVVHNEVKTANGRSLGELADDGETLRIEKKRVADRTEAEREHLGAVPPK